MDNKPVKDQEIAEVKEIKPVVSAPVVTKKRSVWDKIKDAFISEDGKSVGDYILIDVLIPAAKKTISDMVTNGVDMILYGSAGNRNRNSNNYIPANRVSYRSYYDQRNNDYARPRSSGSAYNYNDIVFQTRGDADAVLNGLRDTINRYGLAKVADYYDLSGCDCSYTDNNYGWTDLRYATVERTSNGFTLRLPKPMPID